MLRGQKFCGSLYIETLFTTQGDQVGKLQLPFLTPDNLIGTPDRTRTCIFHPVTRYGLEDRDDTEAYLATMRSSRLTDSNGLVTRVVSTYLR